LQLLKEIAPATDRVVIIYNPDTAPYKIFIPIMETVAPQMAMTLAHAPVTDKNAIENALRAAAGTPGRALMIMPDVFMALHRQTIFKLAIDGRLPTVCPLLFFTMAAA
jgi:putative ABC transport system substrate-binding protein